MKIAIHQPNSLPWIGYFDKIDQVDKFIILDKALHTKSGFVHRNKIKTPQGPIMLSVPLKNKEKPINELLIANETNWRSKHWKIIKNNYKNTPFWSLYKEGFEEIFEKEWKYLDSLNTTLIKHILSLLSITTEILKESDFKIDFGHGNLRNVNIVSHLGGNIYLSGVGAKVYNNPEEFKNRRIELNYQNFNHPIYSQRFGNFESHLSIIDLLFNSGPESIELIRKQRNEQ